MLYLLCIVINIFMEREQIVDSILGSKEEYVEMLEDFMDTLEDTIWMMKTSDQYTENEIYNKIESLRCYCDCMVSDNRGTGTLMEDLGI